MKNTFKLYLTLWVVLFTFLNVNAQQCETIMKFFKEDMYTSKELAAFAEKDPQKAFDSWKILYNDKGGLTRSVEELNLVSKNLDEISKAGGYLKWKKAQDIGKETGSSVIKRIGTNKFGTVEVLIEDVQRIHGVPKKGTPENYIDILAADMKTKGYNLDEAAIEGYAMPDGKIIIIDGHHRLAALEKLGEKNIPIRIQKQMDPRGLRLNLKIGEYSGFYPPSKYPEGFVIPDFGKEENMSIDGEALRFVATMFD